jgi:hypothetical protein
LRVFEVRAPRRPARPSTLRGASAARRCTRQAMPCSTRRCCASGSWPRTRGCPS